VCLAVAGVVCSVASVGWLAFICRVLLSSADYGCGEVFRAVFSFGVCVISGYFPCLCFGLYWCLYVSYWCWVVASVGFLRCAVLAFWLVGVAVVAFWLPGFLACFVRALGGDVRPV
jgi:hypothetical protein